MLIVCVVSRPELMLYHLGFRRVLEILSSDAYFVAHRNAVTVMGLHTTTLISLVGNKTVWGIIPDSTRAHGRLEKYFSRWD